LSRRQRMYWKGRCSRKLLLKKRGQNKRKGKEKKKKKKKVNWVYGGASRAHFPT